MKYSAAVFATLAGLSMASPLIKRQDIDFAAYNAVPTLPDVAAPIGDVDASEPTYVASVVADAAASAATAASDSNSVGSGSDAVVDTSDSDDSDVSKRSLSKRACAARTPGTGPAVTNPDTPAAFKAYANFTTLANNAITPPGYKAVVVNASASAQDSTYMTYKILSSYDPNACASFCQANQGCNSFNLYFERDPIVTPGSSSSSSCYNPTSLTYIKCALYGGLLTSTSAKNTGGWQGGFNVVIAGSNIYALTAPATPTNFTGPYYYNNATIQATGYMGLQTFPQTQPYDPSVCAAACTEKSAFDISQGLPSAANPDVCNMFVAYILYKNGGNGVFTCTYYNTAWDASYATNVGQYDNSGNHYTIGSANGFAIDGATWDSPTSL